MGLRAIFAKGAKSIWQAVGDIKVNAIYTSRAVGIYDATTDITTNIDTTYSVDVILLSDKRNKDIPTGKEPIYKQALILADAISVVPQMEDVLSVSDQDYIIGPVSLDPAGAIWTLELLRP